MRRLSLNRCEAPAIDTSINESERRVLNLIAVAGEPGLTCDQIEEATELRHQTCSARVRELALKGWIEDSGERRRTRGGRSAVVWKMSEPL